MATLDPNAHRSGRESPNADGVQHDGIQRDGVRDGVHDGNHTPFDARPHAATPAVAAPSARLETPVVSTAPTTGAPRRKRNFLPYIGGAVGLLLIAAVMRNRAKSGASAGAQGGRKADTTKVANFLRLSTGNITQSISVTGQLRANQSIGLSSKIAGRVANVTVNEGDRVTKGQLMVTLEDQELRAQAEQASANLSAAQVRLQQARVGLPARVAAINTAITQQRAGLQTSQARLRQAVLNQPLRTSTARTGLQQARETVKQASSRLAQARETARQVDLSTRAQVRASQAAVRAAQANAANIERGSRQQQIAQAQQNVNVLQASLRLADITLRRQQILVQGGAAPQSALDQAQAARDQTEAQLVSAQQNLSLVREGNTNEQIQQARQQVQQAQAQLAQAQAGRAAVINAQQDITSALAQLTSAQAAQSQSQANLATIPQAAEDVRAAREAVGQAQAQLDAAVANRAQIAVAQADVPAAQAAVNQAQAQLDAAQTNLNNGRIYSPVNGVVSAKNADVGQAATPGVALLTLVSLEGVYFEAQVSQNDLGRVKSGQSVQVSAPSVNAQGLQGTVSDIIPVADPRLRLFRVRVSLQNPPSNITPGAFASGTISTETNRNILIVPSSAVQTDENDVSSVLVAVKQTKKSGAQTGNAQTAGQSGDTQNAPSSGTEKGAVRPKAQTFVTERRVVKLGGSQGENLQVLSGVKAGDIVVLNIGAVNEGDIVKLANKPGLPGAADAIADANANSDAVNANSGGSGGGQVGGATGTSDGSTGSSGGASGGSSSGTGASSASGGAGGGV